MKKWKAFWDASAEWWETTSTKYAKHNGRGVYVDGDWIVSNHNVRGQYLLPVTYIRRNGWWAKFVYGKRYATTT